jgi:hypothetical protein
MDYLLNGKRGGGVAAAKTACQDPLALLGSVNRADKSIYETDTGR